MKRPFTCLSLVVLLFVLLGDLPVLSDATAQQVYTYSNRMPGPNRMPSLKCSKAVYGSKITISIREAPPESIVWFTMSLLEGDSQENGGFASTEAGEPDLSAINSWHEAAVVDRQGRAFFDIPLGDRPDWMGKTVLFKAYIKDNSIEDNSHLLQAVFTVDNPELCIVSTAGSPGRVEGRISKLDEFAGKWIAEINGIAGSPGKTVFTRDFLLGFTMLDGDRIAVFDNPGNRLIYIEQAGLGLVDIAVTPDGRKLIVLTRGARATDPYAPGELWIYDVDALRDPNRFSNPTRYTINPISVEDNPVSAESHPASAEGVRNLLAVSEDSTMLAIRQGEMDMGCFDLLSGQYDVCRLGDMKHFKSEIRDIKVVGNRLLALIDLWDGSSELMIVNLQNVDLQCSIPVGSGVDRIALYHPEGGQPGVVLLDAADESCDYLIRIDILTDEAPKMIRLPDGVVDFDVTETRGLCMFLLQPGDPRPNDGMDGQVRFVDLEQSRILQQSIPLDLGSDASVYLSRAECSNMGYVYTERGDVIQIDLDTFEVVNRLQVNGDCTGPVIEIY